MPQARAASRTGAGRPRARRAPAGEETRPAPSATALRRNTVRAAAASLPPHVAHAALEIYRAACALMGAVALQLRLQCSPVATAWAGSPAVRTDLSDLAPLCAPQHRPALPCDVQGGAAPGEASAAAASGGSNAPRAARAPAPARPRQRDRVRAAAPSQLLACMRRRDWRLGFRAIASCAHIQGSQA